MVEAAARRDGEREPLHPEERRLRRDQAQSRFRQKPRPRRHDIARPPVSAVTRLCLGAGARKVIVADNPINNPKAASSRPRSARRPSAPGELMLPKDSMFEQLYVGGETITSTWRDVLPPRSARSGQGHRHLAGQGP